MGRKSIIMSIIIMGVATIVTAIAQINCQYRTLFLNRGQAKVRELRLIMSAIVCVYDK